LAKYCRNIVAELKRLLSPTPARIIVSGVIFSEKREKV